MMVSLITTIRHKDLDTNTMKNKMKTRNYNIKCVHIFRNTAPFL
jgi:hypothetical protein